MLTVFNRRELMLILDLDTLYRVRQALEAAGIECAVRSPGRMGSAGRRSRGIPGVRPDYANQYAVYVKKEEYDRAMQVIQPVLRG